MSRRFIKAKSPPTIFPTSEIKIRTEILFFSWMHFTTYILYSTKINKFYVGQTSNIVRRIYEHNMQNSRFTSLGVPWTLIWLKQFSSRIEAIQLERKLKNLSRKRKIKFISKYAEYSVKTLNVEKLDAFLK